MTHEEFISLVKQPELVASHNVSDLKELINLYPYFVPARLFYAKALQQSGSVLFASNLKFSSLYSANRRWLYYYIHPDKKISTEPYRREKTSKSSGDYFDMINAVESEGGDSKQTLKNLAERLKSARTMVVSSTTHATKKIPAINVLDEFDEEKSVLIKQIPRAGSEISEDKAKKLIQERKYLDAIEILKALNLNNPKKSVYFADQIRFLEKVIANSKK
ncbi:MAG TPA: hypothetical protein VI413_13185 [Paludibacter sp.]